MAKGTMRTGIDIVFDNYADTEGIIRAAIRLLSKGKKLHEAADLLDLTDEQVKQVELRSGLKREFA